MIFRSIGENKRLDKGYMDWVNCWEKGSEKRYIRVERNGVVIGSLDIISFLSEFEIFWK